MLTPPRQRKRRFLTGLAATAVAVGVLAPTAAIASSTSASAPAVPAAGLAAGWLAGQISAHGGYLTSFGVPDQTDTAYAVVGMYAAQVGRDASAQALGYLKAQLGVALQGQDGNDSPGTLGFYILAAVSAGQDPYHFGGSGQQNDLVARLLATARTSGPAAGLFGTADPTYDGAFRQGVALAALHAAGVPPSNGTVAAGIGWLTGQQCANGLWQGYRPDTSVPCPAADPATFTGPDSNSTGMAVQGLAAYNRSPQRSAMLASLHAVQAADGGFPLIAAPGQASDPDSTALTVQALLATGSPLASWQQGTGDPMSALLSYQLGCSDPAASRGAFYYPGDRSANVIATVQSVPAAARLSLSDLQPQSASAAVPQQDCATGQPSAVTTPPVAASSPASRPASATASATASASTPIENSAVSAAELANTGPHRNALLVAGLLLAAGILLTVAGRRRPIRGRYR